MKAVFLKFITRLLSTIVLYAMLFTLPGNSIRVVFALTTTVNDIAAPAIAIPDPAVGSSCTSSVTRTINVATSVVVADINVGLNISHSRRSDVRATLTSPSGTTIVLISGGGLGSPTIASPDSYNNYDLMLDDTSVGSIHDNGDDAVGAPFFDRTAGPFELLSAFKGQNAVGNWT